MSKYKGYIESIDALTFSVRLTDSGVADISGPIALTELSAQQRQDIRPGMRLSVIYNETGMTINLQTKDPEMAKMVADITREAEQIREEARKLLARSYPA